MKTLKRKHQKTAPEKMTNVNTKYLRKVIKQNGLNQSDLSVRMGYCPEYLSNSIADGRMQIELLKWLSEKLQFPYKDALDGKYKRKTIKEIMDSQDIFDFLDDVKL